MEPLELLGSKTRLEILHKLSSRDMYVSELMEEVGMDGKTAKHHLDMMEEAGVISSREEGRRRYYSVEKEVMLKVSPSPNRRFEANFCPIE